MLLSFFITLLPLALAAVVPAPAAPRSEQAAQVCYSGEKKTLLCYNKGQGTPQDVSVSDVAAAAAALREWGTEMREKLDGNGNPVVDDNGLSLEEPFYRYLDMNRTTAPDCGEWTIYTYQSVLVAAKLMQRRQNALVWFGDVADAIDGGGERATAAQRSASILGRCGVDGGSKEVNATLAHEAYKPWKFEYESGSKISTDIVIKVVENREWKQAQTEE